MLKKALSFLQLRKSDFFGFRTGNSRWHALKDHLKLVLRPVVLFILFWSVLNSGSSQLFGQLRAEQGESTKNITFAADSCETANISTSTGWQGANAASGLPSVANASGKGYDDQNSARYAGGDGELICQKYQVNGDDAALRPDQKIENVTDQGTTASSSLEVAIDNVAAEQAGATSTAIASPDQSSTTPGQSDAGSSTRPQSDNTDNSDAGILPNLVGGYDLLNQVIDTIGQAVNEQLSAVIDGTSAASAPTGLADDQKLQSAKIRLSLSVQEKARLDEIMAGSTSTASFAIWYSLSDNSALELSASSSDTWSELWQELAVMPIGTSTECGDIRTDYACLKELAAVGQLSASSSIEATTSQGSYYVFDAPFIKSGLDARNLRIKVSGIGTSSFETYLDSVWVTAAVGEGDDVSGDTGYDQGDKIVFNDKEINFTHTDDNADENLIIKTDRAVYDGVGGNDVYFSVTNKGTTTENVDLQVHFPEDKGEVISLERLHLAEKTWEEREIRQDKLPEPQFYQKSYYRGYQPKPLPSGMRAKESTVKSTALAPGKTQYFKMQISYPEQSSGEFYIEALGDNQGYGLLDPWWSSNWLYKLPITIDNRASTQAQTDFQMLIEISSTTPNFWQNVNSDGSDIRFMDATQTTALPFWVQYWNKAGSSTQIWVKTSAIPASATTTIYLYYGNKTAASTSDMYSTFSYSSMQDLYYVVTNTFATVTVASLIDSNQVQFSNGTVTNLNRQQIASFVPVTATSVLRVKGPVQANITGVQTGSTLVPISYGGTAFAAPYGTNVATEAWSRYSPYLRATTTIYNGNTADAARYIATGTASTTVYNITNNGTTRLTSSSTILATYYISNTSYSAAAYPATLRDLYGVRSGTNNVGFTGATNFSIFCSGGTTVNVTNQTTAALYANATCATANQGAGNAVRLTAQTNPIASIQLNDGDGTAMTYFLPDVELATEYVVPTDAQYIAAACPPKYGTDTLALYNPANAFVASTSCNINGNYPGKAFFGSTTNGIFIPAGSRVTSLTGDPFYAYYEDYTTPGGAGGDESNFLGAVQARKDALVDPTYSIGAQQSFSIVISGKVYADEGSTTLLSAPIVSVVIDGRFVGSTTASAANGTYSLNYASTTWVPQAGSTTLVYLDNGTVFGASYTRYSGLGDMSGYDIYQNRIKVENDDAGPITNADIAKYDNTKSNNLKVNVTANNLTASGTQMLYVAASTTYAPGGAIAIPAQGATSTQPGGDIKISTTTSVLDIGTNAISLSGDWQNFGTFSDAAGQVTTFTATNTGYSVQNNGQNFHKVVFNGAGGGWSFATTTTLDNDLVVAAGTLTGTTSLLIKGANATGDGVINLTGGEFLLAGGGSFGGNSNWNFSSLTFGTGTVSAITKNGIGSTTVNNLLTIATSSVLNASTTTWIIAGSGTPLNLLGSLSSATSTFRFIATSTAYISAADFYRLELSPSGAGSPTFTVLSGTLSVRENLLLGNGTNPVTVTANVNNPAVTVGGNLAIATSSTLAASATANLTVGGNYTNSGSFIHNNGTVIFDASSTGKTISAGTSPFYKVAFNNILGGWTVNQNATSTNNWSLVAGSQFTVASGVTLEIQGLFINSFAKASTTWTGSTLFLSSTSQTLNAKTDSGASFNALRLGNGVKVKMWNSSVSSCTFGANSYLYSMDNNAVDGSLYIWGDYYSTSTENWSYKTDFDGMDLSAAPRQANVRLAANSTTTIATSTFNIIGSSTAPTAIANQGGGTFALKISSSTLAADYFQIRNADAKGLDISGSSTVSNLAHGDLLLQANGYSLITLNAAAMNQTGAKSWPTMVFASSSGITGGFNVNLAGTPNVAWNFSGSTGNLASENFDNDAGDPRGYLVWDDSPDWLPRSQNWQWFFDQNLETPTTTAASENATPSNIANDNVLKLRITVKETNNLVGNNVKLRLQYSTSYDFSSGVYDVGEIGSSSIWTYGNGIDNDNDPVLKNLLSDSSATSTHNESGSSISNYTFKPNSSAEWEFTVRANGAATGTLYYFRAYANQPKIGAVLPNTDKTYPSLMINQNALVSSLSGYNTGSSVAGVSIGATSTPTAMPFGDLTFGVDMAGAQQLSVTTNAEFGYQLFVQENHDLNSANGAAIPDVPGDNANPAAWPLSDVSAFGYHTSDMTLSGANPSRFASDNTYAKFESAMREVSFSPVPVVNEKTNIVYRIKAASQQKAGDYQNSIEYIVVPTY